jgi:hypothetical protein
MPTSSPHAMPHRPHSSASRYQFGGSNYTHGPQPWESLRTEQPDTRRCEAISSIRVQRPVPVQASWRQPEHALHSTGKSSACTVAQGWPLVQVVLKLTNE